MSLKARLVEWAVGRLRRRGFQVSRLPFPNDHPIDLLALLVNTVPRTGAAFSLVQIGANDGVSEDPVRDLILTRGGRPSWSSHSRMLTSGCAARTPGCPG